MHDQKSGPEFARLLFWHHATRLETELYDAIGRSPVRIELIKDTCFLECGWIALSAGRTFKDAGFIACASWFPNAHNEEGNPDSLKFIFELELRRGYFKVLLDQFEKEGNLFLNTSTPSVFKDFCSNYNGLMGKGATRSIIKNILRGKASPASIKDFSEIYISLFYERF